MTEPRDEIDSWLERDVNPLSPPPGALNRIRKRARQRKMRQALVASAGCAVVLAAGAAVPSVVAGFRPGGPNQPAAGNQSQLTSPPGPAQSPASSTPGPLATGRPIQLHQRTHLSTGTSGTNPPANFRPTSVTFVGDDQGGVVGAVIGQAGPPCATQYCTSMAGTSNYGSSWYGVSAPVAPDPSKPAGVSQLRFANLRDGWAYGPALYETSGGGWPWRAVDTGGQQVTALEASGQTAFAVFATCSASAAGYAADCTRFTLYSSAAGSTVWTPVAVPAGYQHMSASLPSSTALVISAGTGYLLTPSGTLLTGPTPGGGWIVAGPAPCKPGPSQPASGVPQDAQLATYQGQLLLACGAQSAGGATIYGSSGGKSWQVAGTVPGPGTVTGLASVDGKDVVVATTAGISYSVDGAASWRYATIRGTAPPSGFSFIGMTNTLQGVAVPADAALGEIYVTGDGGKTWTPSRIAG